jgi:hypothetical protein
MDKNEIDNAAHEIQQMIAVLHRSIESRLRSGKDPEVGGGGRTQARLRSKNDAVD